MCRAYVTEWCSPGYAGAVGAIIEAIAGLIKLIDKHQRKPIYTDFADIIGDEEFVDLPGFTI